MRPCHCQFRTSPCLATRPRPLNAAQGISTPMGMRPLSDYTWYSCELELDDGRKYKAYSTALGCDKSASRSARCGAWDSINNQVAADGGSPGWERLGECNYVVHFKRGAKSFSRSGPTCRDFPGDFSTKQADHKSDTGQLQLSSDATP